MLYLWNVALTFIFLFKLFLTPVLNTSSCYSHNQKFLVAISQPGPPQFIFLLLLPLLILTYPTLSKIRTFYNYALYFLTAFISSANIPLLSSQQLEYNFPFKPQVKCSQVCSPYLPTGSNLIFSKYWGNYFFFLSFSLAAYQLQATILATLESE